MVTGDRGYIGSVLIPILLEKNYDVLGIDSGYFKENLLCNHIFDYEKLTCDIRDIESQIFRNIDAVIHLAGLSNDPLGELTPNITYEINHKATINLAIMAKMSGVKRFIYSSSQSMYGISSSSEELDEYNSEKNPLTAYASAKWMAEQDLKKLNDEKFTVVSFRPSTVFGASPRLRTDIVFNNLLACSYTTGNIEIKSDGSPWRPIIHVKDVCDAFIAGIEAPKKLVSGKSYNVGLKKGGNYTVRQIAEAASNAYQGSNLKFIGEHSDPRSYKVSFERIHNELGEFFKPSWNLSRGGKELIEFFKKVEFSEEKFRGRLTNRLKQISYLLKNEKLDSNLRFIEKN